MRLLRRLSAMFATSTAVIAISPLHRAEAFECDEGSGVDVTAEAGRARTWRQSWTIVNGASAVAGLAAVPLVDPAGRKDMILGSAVSAASALVTWVWPLEVESFSDQPPATCTSVETRQRIASAAADEAARVSWPWHLLNAGVSAALSAVMFYGFRHPKSAVIAGVGSFVAGEAQLFTQPTSLSAAPTALSPSSAPELVLSAAFTW